MRTLWLIITMQEVRQTIHRWFQGRELTRALMVTVEGSAERHVAPMGIPREARKHLDELS